MDKLLIVCGPTATGKTKLAIYLAKQFDGEIISADSRQVYKGFDALTGKDLPKNIKYQSTSWRTNIKYKYKNKRYQLPFYEINKIRLWMYDVVAPNEEFSVAHYQVLARQIIADIWARGKLPIVVGGTGLYLRTLTQNLSTIQIPSNPRLRKKLATQSVVELQQNMQELDPDKWEQMNRSDRGNPRRLVRAIEIATWRKSHRPVSLAAEAMNVLWIGLGAPKEILRQEIEKKISQRFSQALGEVKQLGKRQLLSGPTTILGLSPLRDFRRARLSRQDARNRWIALEYGYAKRQLTWFKKQKEIHWFDISQSDYRPEVKHLVKTWYTKD